MKRRFPLHIHISTLFLILLLIVGGGIGWLGYTISRDILYSTSNTLNSRIAQEALREFKNAIGPAEMAARGGHFKRGNPPAAGGQSLASSALGSANFGSAFRACWNAVRAPALPLNGSSCGW